MIVCLQVNFRLHSIVEWAPQKFIGYLLAILSNCLCYAKVNRQVIYMAYDDILLVNIGINLKLLQHGTNAAAIRAVDIGSLCRRIE